MITPFDWLATALIYRVYNLSVPSCSRHNFRHQLFLFCVCFSFRMGISVPSIILTALKIIESERETDKICCGCDGASLGIMYTVYEMKRPRGLRWITLIRISPHSMPSIFRSLSFSLSSVRLVALLLAHMLTHIHMHHSLARALPASQWVCVSVYLYRFRLRNILLNVKLTNKKENRRTDKNKIKQQTEFLLSAILFRFECHVLFFILFVCLLIRIK